MSSRQRIVGPVESVRPLLVHEEEAGRRRPIFDIEEKRHDGRTAEGIRPLCRILCLTYTTASHLV